jgi:transcription initiation factor TFIID subunit 5
MWFQNTEDLLKREANLTDVGSTEETSQTDSEVSSVLSAYKSEGDTEVYEGAYTELKRFVEGALDIYKVMNFQSRLSS